MIGFDGFLRFFFLTFNLTRCQHLSMFPLLPNGAPNGQEPTDECEYEVRQGPPKPWVFRGWNLYPIIWGFFHTALKRIPGTEKNNQDFMDFVRDPHFFFVALVFGVWFVRVNRDALDSLQCLVFRFTLPVCWWWEYVLFNSWDARTKSRWWHWFNYQNNWIFTSKAQ